MALVEPGYVGAAWAAGAAPWYDRLAAAVVAHTPVSVAGARVLDLGAGTGAASRAVAAAGVASSRSTSTLDMLAFDRRVRPPSAVADARALPFGPAAFDIVVGAFCLSHVDPPVSALCEAARVLRPRGALVAGSFAGGERHAAKAIVDALLVAEGWRPPDWYEHVKRQVEPLLGEPESLRGIAGAAGLVDIDVRVTSVDAGRWSAAALVAWRLSMGHVAAFVSTLPHSRAAALRQAAVVALGADPLRRAARRRARPDVAKVRRPNASAIAMTPRVGACHDGAPLGLPGPMLAARPIGSTGRCPRRSRRCP